ncbi:lytic transglycosylase domain-containing protein [Nocardioides sp. LHG3406-4]|uniref:lytic transglycosylase domain-containing protein n=1 Tax=Nocardioides sp. LHG3406-4 TaxID=2804575 RepID=UPI003CF1B6CB
MSASRFGRIQKATAIVPLALLSAAWTASLAGVGAGTASADGEGTTLPDGTRVPSQAVEAPASMSVPGVVAPGIGGSSARSVVASASPSGIPAAALAAYQRAEAVINSADKSCHVSWQLIAAIGRVESDHGRYAGNVLDDNGLAKPGIYGVPLNGRGDTQEIGDTDAGQYDNDTTFDRAVGPMQFIPSTWAVVGVDGDSDGKRNPQDIDDAALATAVYLCSGDEDLSGEAGQRATVYRYNHSNDYVDLVLSIMHAYLDGDYLSLPNTTTAARVFLPDTTGPGGRGRGGTGDGRSGADRDGKDKDKGDKGDRGDGRDDPTAPPTAPPTKPPADPPTNPPTKDPGNPPTKVPTNPPTVSVPTVLPTDLPTLTVPSVGPVLTYAQAQAQCIASGISVLNVQALTTCINNLLHP